jgi:hypothetical protein
VRIWLAFSDEELASLVAAYMEDAGAFDEAQFVDLSPSVTLFGVPEEPVLRRRIARGEEYTDPLYGVVATKRQNES